MMAMVEKSLLNKHMQCIFISSHVDFSLTVFFFRISSRTFAIDFGLSVKRLFNICGNKLNGNENLYFFDFPQKYHIN